MKTTILLLILATILFFCVGCDEGQRTPENIADLKIKKDITDSITKVDTNTKIIEVKINDISQEAQKIYDKTVEIQSGLTEENKIKMNPYLNNVKVSSQVIIKDTKEIIRANMDLITIKAVLESAVDKVETTDELLKTLVKERDDLTIALEKAEEARDSALHGAIRWLILASIVGAAALGVFGLMYGSKMCLTLSAVCIVVMSVAIFVETYFIYLVIFGGLILLGLVVAIIWNIIIQKRAFKEVVNTVEVVQDNMSEETKNILFGGKDRTGIMDSIQSPETMKLVKREKSKINSLWLYAKSRNKNNGNT